MFNFPYIYLKLSFVNSQLTKTIQHSKRKNTDIYTGY